MLTGNDQFGTFAPNTNIDRSSVAAVVSRLIDTNSRKKFVLKVEDKPNIIELDNNKYVFSMTDADIKNAIEAGKADFAIVTTKLLNEFGVPLSSMNLTKPSNKFYFDILEHETHVSVYTPYVHIARESCIANMSFSNYAFEEAKQFYNQESATKAIRFEIRAAEDVYDNNASFVIGIVQNGKNIVPSSISGLNELPSMSSSWPDSPAYYRVISLTVPQNDIDINAPLELIIRYVTGDEFVYEINLRDYVIR